MHADVYYMEASGGPPESDDTGQVLPLVPQHHAVGHDLLHLQLDVVLTRTSSSTHLQLNPALSPLTSIGTGATFSPPPVTMISFWRPPMYRKPSSSNLGRWSAESRILPESTTLQCSLHSAAYTVQPRQCSLDSAA